MTDPWANSRAAKRGPDTDATADRDPGAGGDLHLEITRPGVRAAIEAALRDAVRGGRLLPGRRLPSSRALAGDLGVARNTVADAYGQLVAEGWLIARQGSGTRVAERPPAPEAAERPPGPEAAERPPGPEGRASPKPPAERRFRYDLRPGIPDLSMFPRAAWIAAMRRALQSLPHDALGYADPRLLPELPGALAEYLARARGVRVAPERIVVCSGFAQGLVLLCEALRARGARTVAVEAYGYHAHRELIAASGLRIKPVAVDAAGAVIDEFGDAGAALLTPAHQFPTGVPLQPRRRRQAVAWAADRGGLIIEDDYDGEFRFDRQAVGAMQALAPEHVVYAGTASKSLAPGLCLGWLVPPTELLDDLLAAKARLDRRTSVLEELALAELIRSGGYDRQVRRCRLQYRRRRERMISELHRAAPAAPVAGVAAGLHLLLELPDRAHEQEAVARAAERGLALAGLATYLATPADPRAGLVVGYATPPEHAFGAAVARLCAVLAELT